MTPAAVLSILVQTKGVGAAQAQLTALDRSAKGAGAGLKGAQDQSGKTAGVLGKLKGAAGLAAGATGVYGLVAAGKAMNSEYREAQKVTAQTNAVLKSTGGVAKISRKGVEDLAGAISKKTAIDDEQIQSGANLLLTFKNIRNETGRGRDIFNQATAAAVDLSAAGFGSLSSTSKQLGKALNDPVKGMTALGRAGVTFSDDQKKAIEALMGTGKAADRVRAQQIILREVQSQVGGSAAAQATQSEKLGVALGNLAEAAGKVLIPALDAAAKIATEFFNQMLEGRGIGGALVKAFGAVAGAIGDVVKTGKDIVKFFKENTTLAEALAGVIVVFAAAYTASLIPALVLSTAMIYAQVAAWVALKVAFLTSPIGLLVVGLAALVAGLIAAYNKSETFRKIVDALFGALKTAAGAVVDFLTHFDEIPGKMLAAGEAIVGGLIDGLKSLPGALADVAGWLKDRLVDGIKLYLAPYRVVGGWILERIVDGVKALAGAVAGAAGWLKNRVVEGIQAYVGAYKAVGSWVLNRIVDGVKVVTSLLASVGGWLKNRITDGVQALAGGFVAVGSWVVNRVAEGFMVVTAELGKVGGWLKNRLVDAFDAVKDGIVGIGGSIIGWIVDGIKDGANSLVGFLNKIIGKVNILPGVEIGAIPKFAAGGFVEKAAGGWIGRPGQAGRDTVPAMLGKGEAVLNRHQQGPVNAALMNTYGMNLGGLFQQVRTPHSQAGTARFAAGGIVGKVGGAIKDVATAPLDLITKGAGFLLKQLPSASSLPDWLEGLGSHILKGVGSFIKEKVGSIFSSGAGAPQGTGGVQAFDGKPVASWIVPILAAARRDGVSFGVSSGFRSFAEQTRLWNQLGRDPAIVARPGTSNHEGSAYPRGAVDISPGWANLAAWLRAHPSIPLRHYGNPRDPYHFSASGHARGGFVGMAKSVPNVPFVGSFKDGGVVPQTGVAMVHAGETITPRGGVATVVHEHNHIYNGPVMQDRQFIEWLRGIERQYSRSNAKPAFGGAS